MLRSVLGRGSALRAARQLSTPPTPPPTAGITTSWGKQFDWQTFILRSDQSSAGLQLYHKLNAQGVTLNDESIKKAVGILNGMMERSLTQIILMIGQPTCLF